MKTLFRLPVLLPAILIASFSYAQPSYREGYIVTNNSDTIKGWIDYRQWEENPKSIRFKTDLKSDKASTYAITDLSGFEIRGTKLEGTFTRFVGFSLNPSMILLSANYHF